MIETLSPHETVNVLVDKDQIAQEVLQRCRPSARNGVRLHSIPTVDSWIRDYGPNFVISNDAGLAYNDWIFNAWGNKYEDLKRDSDIPKRLEPVLQIPRFEPGIVMEGGSIEVDGCGCVLTTEQCLLNPNRNPQLTRSEIEQYLKLYLGAAKVLWLGEGIVGDDTDGHIDDMARQIGALRARIETLEAHPVPYSAEELALMSKPDVSLMAVVRAGARKSPKELPPRASALLAEARRHFLANELDQAEAKYNEVLKLDDKNVSTLADLASIEVLSGRMAEAEKNIKAALAVDPNDDYSLFVLGQLKFAQKNYDEAFDALSHAAQINPQNAKIQNYLGLTLSEKGLHLPAESAFRKAVQIDPGFAEAHLNLAVVYITQKPPLEALAKWEYQKALGLGHAPNPGLEALLDPAKSAAAAAH